MKVEVGELRRTRKETDMDQSIERGKELAMWLEHRETAPDKG